jgi:hypothetical protein
MKNFIVILSFLFLPAVSIAQVSQQERALHDYSKKYDQEKSEQRLNEIDNNLNNPHSKRQADEVIDTLLWLFGISIVGAIAWTFIKLRVSSTEEFYYKMSAHDINEKTVSSMSIDQIRFKTGLDKNEIYKILKALNWTAADFQPNDLNNNQNDVDQKRRIEVRSELIKDVGKINNLTLEEIGSMDGTTKRSVQAWLARNGLHCKDYDPKS